MCWVGVEGGGLGIAGDDRLVDHAVLGDVDSCPSGDRDRVVAQPLPQRLVHQGGHVVGEREQDRVAGHRRELAVEQAIRACSRWRCRPARPPSPRAGSRPRCRAGARAAASRATAGSSCSARLEHGRRAGVVRRLGGRRPRGDERAGALARLHHALDLQRRDRLAHRGAADLERAREVALRRQPLAGRQRAGADVRGEALGDLLVALQRSESGQARHELVRSEYHGDADSRTRP